MLESASPCDKRGGHPTPAASQFACAQAPAPAGLMSVNVTFGCGSDRTAVTAPITRASADIHHMLSAHGKSPATSPSGNRAIAVRVRAKEHRVRSRRRKRRVQEEVVIQARNPNQTAQHAPRRAAPTSPRRARNATSSRCQSHPRPARTVDSTRTRHADLSPAARSGSSRNHARMGSRRWRNEADTARSSSALSNPVSAATRPMVTLAPADPSPPQKMTAIQVKAIRTALQPHQSAFGQVARALRLLSHQRVMHLAVPRLRVFHVQYRVQIKIVPRLRRRPSAAATPSLTFAARPGAVSSITPSAPIA